MPKQIDIDQTAKFLIDHHGDNAAFEVALKADEMLARGNMEGSATWRAILRAVESLQQEQPSGPVH